MMLSLSKLVLFLVAAIVARAAQPTPAPIAKRQSGDPFGGSDPFTDSVFGTDFGGSSADDANTSSGAPNIIINDSGTFTNSVATRRDPTTSPGVTSIMQGTRGTTIASGSTASPSSSSSSRTTASSSSSTSSRASASSAPNAATHAVQTSKATASLAILTVSILAAGAWML